MSEADVRPAPTRGRSSTRGRGGFSRGGPRGGRKQTNGTTTTDPTGLDELMEDQGELGEMKKRYSTELVMLKELFPAWTDVDLLFALEEVDGDVPSAVEKITQGNVSQFAEVKKTKDRARSKLKDDAPISGAVDKSGIGARGGRGRGGLESGRGGRGRASDRGRGGHRGGRGGHATTNGVSKDLGATSIPTTESSAWDTTNSAGTAPGTAENTTQEIAKDASEAGKSAWANVVTADTTPAAASEGTKPSVLPEGAPKKTWASMLKPAPVPVPIKKAPQPPPVELVASEHIPSSAAQLVIPTKEPEPIPPAPAIPEPQPDPAIEPPLIDEASLTPSKDPLTEENVEHLPDESIPPATLTVASTTGSMDPRNMTPVPTAQAPTARPPMGGYATSANRLAGTVGRSASFQRRVLEQQEAVVMPGHNAVDRAAVQFGSMGLNGEPGLDVDDDREEPETRQPPQHSPPSQPRTSLPPVPRQASSGAQEIGLSESVQTPKQAPGLPPASAQNQQQIQQEPSLASGVPQDAQLNQSYNQFGRYGQPGMQQESGVPQQKPLDSFSHQAQQGHYDQYGAHNQQASQQQAQTGFGGLSSAPSDYSSYYTSDQSRNSYNQYFGNTYAPQESRTQAGHSQQDPMGGQQRSTSGFGAGPNENSFASQTQQQAQSRFGDVPGSGNNTPNPLGGGQQPSAPAAHQSQHSMHQAQSHQQQGGYAGGAGSGFPYGHPYYNSPYQQAYQNQFGYNPQLSGYGGGFPAKQGNIYGAPHGYGMGGQSSYDQHSSSPANAGPFGQNQQNTMRSASGMGSGLGGLDDYGRNSHQQSSGGFGGVSDPFARSASGFGGQGSYGQQSMSSGPEDALKPFGDAKSGPSPALGQPGRPGSATNSASGQTQSGLPPPQSHQSGFGGGYPGFPSQGNQYGSLGGLGGHQQGQSGMGGQNTYGSYGAGGFNQGYGSYGGSRGGWGQNYGAH